MYQDDGMQQQQLDDGGAYQHDGSDAPMQESMEDAPGAMPQQDTPDESPAVMPEQQPDGGQAEQSPGVAPEEPATAMQDTPEAAANQSQENNTGGEQT